MPGTKNIPEARLIAALRKADGVKAVAARALGITRQTVQQRVSNSPRLQAELRDIEETILDTSEKIVNKAITAGDKDMAKWRLTQKGASRGYGNKITASFDDQAAAAIVAALGGDPAAYRSALLRLGVPSSEIPG